MSTPTESGLDPLTALQLQVARRADEIAATRPGRSFLNLSCWLQAEEEMFGQLRGPASGTNADHFRPSQAMFAASAHAELQAHG